jgi:hypothetical protein
MRGGPFCWRARIDASIILRVLTIDLADIDRFREAALLAI